MCPDSESEWCHLGIIGEFEISKMADKMAAKIDTFDIYPCVWAKSVLFVTKYWCYGQQRQILSWNVTFDLLKTKMADKMAAKCQYFRENWKNSTRCFCIRSICNLCIMNVFICETFHSSYVNTMYKLLIIQYGGQDGRQNWKVLY